MVDASGVVVAEAVIVGEGDLRGWVVELPAGLIPPEDDGMDGSSSGSSESSSEGFTEEVAPTTVAGGGVATTAGSGEAEEGDGLQVVAYAADGTELARQPLP